MIPYRAVGVTPAYAQVRAVYLPPVCAVERLAFTVRRAHACANDVPVHVDQLFCIHLVASVEA